MDYKQQTNNLNKILLTGGHGATAGLAVIEVIKKRLPNTQIFWIGSNTAIPGSNVKSLEYKIYPSMGVKYFSINAGKLQTKFTRYTIPLILMIPLGFIQALFLVIRIRPSITFSFGGFASFPVIFWSWVFGIPVILHEQTIAAGRASIASTFFARKIALSHNESLNFFPKNKCVITGNPVRSSVFNVKPKISLGESKTILVMGGSRGSEFINEEFAKILDKLITKYHIVHITGERDYPKYKDLKIKNYQVIPFVNPEEMQKLYQKSDVIISRSGANTVSELMVIKRPVILIPLPRTFMKEQEKNAKFAKEFGIAEVLSENDVSDGALLPVIEKLFTNWKTIVRRTIDKKSLDENATEKILNLILELA
jgi:UDP-N-acetylglucosamine--N-acetylmuramyl-(pentapeptide) pyrophosphoryl-undecaprenol N-acetylglucosamine transferase